MYLVLDIETVPDHDVLIEAAQHIEGWDGTTPILEDRKACLERAELELCEKQGGDNCFWPLRFHKPVLVSMIAVDPNMNYLAHRTVWGKTAQRVAEDFWGLMNEAPGALNIQNVVTFNGKRFDMPVMELQAMRYGLSCPWWFRDFQSKPWENPRSQSPANRIHLDMWAELAGSNVVAGDLNYWSKVFGLPGKIDTRGNAVTDLFEAEDWDRIQDYCLCDCLNTLGLLMGFMHSCYPNMPHPRGGVFEGTMNTIIGARRTEGTTSNELERYWNLYGTEIPF